MESRSRPGVGFLVDAAGTSCACEAGRQAGDPVCCHRALARFITGGMALPLEARPACRGEGGEGVGWTPAPDVVACSGGSGAGAVEVEGAGVATSGRRDGGG